MVSFILHREVNADGNPVFCIDENTIDNVYGGYEMSSNSTGAIQKNKKL